MKLLSATDDSRTMSATVFPDRANYWLAIQNNVQEGRVASRGYDGVSRRVILIQHCRAATARNGLEIRSRHQEGTASGESANHFGQSQVGRNALASADAVST